MARGRKSNAQKELERQQAELAAKEQEIQQDLDIIRQSLVKKSLGNVVWDVPIDQEITYFDPTLSYELTGYRPVDEERGFDFDPEWFQQSKRVKLETGKYCAFPHGTKKYHDFWTEEYKRCNEGMTVNGYTVTGDHYFFLNYYQLKESKVAQAGQGRGMVFPEFFSKQYEYFHYINMCERLHKDVCAVKSRGIGFSEIAASLGAGAYTTRRNCHIVYAAFTDKYVDDVLEKTWYQLDNLNANSEGGMKHVRQKYNSERHKKASKINKQREEISTSWGSDIEGLVVDKPRKLRGDRIDRLFLEESGSNPILLKTYLQGEALITVMGNRIGTRFVWGTGGDTGGMDGLSKMFYNPEGYSVLPYRHNHTKTGEYVLTAFFAPAYSFITKDGYIDSRGVTDSIKAKKYYEEQRNKLLSNPKEYLIKSAEWCFTPEDAFAFEGDNQFNTVLLAEQQAAIKLHKIGEPIQIGNLEYKFKGGIQKEENIEGVRFVPNVNGKTHILELPISDTPPPNLYVAGIDGIDMGGEDTSDQTRDPSDFCVVVMKRAHGLEPPKIVAYYKDRPQKIKDAHINCLRLLQLYNAKACLESTRISIQQFFREKKCAEKYLMRRPRACQSDMQSGRSKQFGAPATEAIIRHQLDLISNYIDEYCSEIWFIEIIEELLKYSYENKRKFDLVAAMGMVLLADEELMFVKPKVETDSSTIFKPFGYYIDEYGIKRKGVIPDRKPTIIYNYTWHESYEDASRPRTSSPESYM